MHFHLVWTGRCSAAFSLQVGIRRFSLLSLARGFSTTGPWLQNLAMGRALQPMQLIVEDCTQRTSPSAT